MEDEILLRKFAATGSDEAFRELVRRHLGMVLGVALRRTGSHCAAEDIAQSVFTVLAQKARRLQAGAGLASWLYRATLIECADVHRRNHAHARKMNALSQHLLTSTTGRSVWQDALPVLDEAIDALPPADRLVILLRFFERRNHREIAAALGKSEAAAQKQGERALRRLASLLRRKGVAITGAALASGLATQVAHAAPAALVNAVSEGALIGASQLSAKVLILQALEAMSSTKVKAAAAVLLLAAVPLTMQWSANHDLREQLDAVRQQLAGAKAALRTAEPPRPSLAIARPRAQRPVPVASLTPPPAPVAAAVTPDDWERALLDPDPLRRTQRIAQLLASLTAEQAPQVAAVFARAHQRGLRFGEEHRLFLRAWGQLDGQAAVQHIAVDAAKVKSSPELLAALAGWASTSPYAARVWAESLPEGSAKEDVLYGLLDGWSMLDFHGAAAYAESRPRSQARNRFRQLLIERALASGGIAGAQQWFSRIRDDEHNSLYKQHAFGEVIQAMLYRDPSAAAHWIAQLGGQPFVTAGPVAETAVKLAEASPAQAMHWLQTLSSHGDAHIAKGRASVLDVWTQQDPHGAGTWLGQQRDRTDYDQLTGKFARSIARENPQTALAWAATIADEKAREQARMAVASDYLKQDGEAARRGLLAAGFTPEMIDRAQSRSMRNEIDELVMQKLSYWITEGVQNESSPMRSWSDPGEAKRNPHGNQYLNRACVECHAGTGGAEAGESLRRLSLDLAGVVTATEAGDPLVGGATTALYRELFDPVSTKPPAGAWFYKETGR